MRYDRRSVLRLSGIAATGTVTGLAGCLGGGGDDEESPEGSPEPTDSGGDGRLSEGDRPAYSRWLTTDENGGLFASYVTLEGEAMDSGSDAEEPSDELMNDPMYGIAAMGSFMASFSLLGLSRFGLGGLSGGSAGTNSGSLDSTATGLVSTQTSVTVLGEMDLAELRSELESDEGVMATAFSEAETLGEFTLFTAEPNEGETGTDAIAISESAVVYAADDAAGQVAAVRNAVQAATGDTTRAADEIDDVDRLLRTAGSGDVVTLRYGDERPDSGQGTGGSGGQDFEELEETDGVIASLDTVEGETTVHGEFAAAVSGEVDALREMLGTSADESATAVADGMLTATATWDDPS